MRAFGPLRILLAWAALTASGCSFLDGPPAPPSLELTLPATVYAGLMLPPPQYRLLNQPRSIRSGVIFRLEENVGGWRGREGSESSLYRSAEGTVSWRGLPAGTYRIRAQIIRELNGRPQLWLELTDPAWEFTIDPTILP